MSLREAEPSRGFRAEAALPPPSQPIEQWLLWEEQANLVGFRTSTRPVEIEICLVPREQVELRIPGSGCAEVLAHFVRGDQVAFPRHPLNRDAQVAYFSEPAVERWTGRFTSSRTLVVPQPPGAALFSLKLATDHPHPDFLQPEKTRLREEASDAIEWVDLLDRVDALLGPDPDLLMVRETLSVLVSGSETGFLARDLRLFQDGSYYLPALSIPWVGRQIARHHGQPFEAFWSEHYAAPAGRAKASLLVRSGLQLETPNPQNVIVQLDAALRPTGRIVLRDLGDAHCATDARSCRDTPWTQLLADIRPETANSFWAFSEAGDHSVNALTLEEWYARHDHAFCATLARRFPELAPAWTASSEAALLHWNTVLRDRASRGAIADGFARRGV